MRPRLQDTGVLGALAALGIYIWWKDDRWRDAASDVLPLLLALPAFAWLRAPWRWRAAPTALLAPRPLVWAALCALAGAALDLTFFWAAAWTLLLSSWMTARCQDPDPAATRQLLVLPLLAFPWLANDVPQLGWWFRLSGAAAAERVLAALHFAVTREGTFLTVNGFAASIEPACSGLNGLQAMLLAGTMVAFFRLRSTAWFWSSLPLFAAAAWVANLLRIVGAAALGAMLPPATAAARVAQFHVFGGWLALCAMFALAVAVTGAMAHASRRRGYSGKWLEFVVLGFGVWRCRELLATWFDSPYDRYGWLAFALWLLPLTRRTARTDVTLDADGGRAWLAGAGVALLGLGALAALNVLDHAGFTLVWLAFMPRTGRLGWALAAVSWWPALGWGASALGLPPAAVAMLRVTLAMVGAAWVWRAGETSYVERDKVLGTHLP